MFGSGKRKKDRRYGDRHCGHADEQEVIPDGIGDNSIIEAATAICRFSASVNAQLSRQNRLLAKAFKADEEHFAALESCFNIAATCQKQTGELVNQSLERHALNPAIVTVDLLADLISQIARRTEALFNDQQMDPAMAPLMSLIFDAAKIAESKKAQLEMQAVRPAEGDDLDSGLHEIVKAVATDDERKNRKIHETVINGLIYRGKTLRPAKVSVYRCQR